MRKMSIEKAVEYSLDKEIVIHTPTQEIYDRLEKYAREHDLDWLGINRISHINHFTEYKGDTCINLSSIYTQYCNVEFYHDEGFEIIELESPNEITITIHSDGHKVVSASCNDITATAKCNDTDTFNLSKGSHMALKRLIDKMNEPVRKDNSNKIEKGDIVELLSTDHTAPREFIGLQGIVMDNDSVPFVKFPIKLRNGLSTWVCMKKYLKLIRKASK